jgi:uncharacterized protein (TIGR02646 family)
MRKVKRSDVGAPTCLNAKGKDGLSELERARAHHLQYGNLREFKFKAYKKSEVGRRLNQLFHGKCAYCETFYAASSPMDVEHFRPKKAVSENPAHPGYWWLAMRWDNLLPSCIDCNRKRKQRVVDISVALTDLYDSMRHHRLGKAATLGKKDSFPLSNENDRLQPESGDHRSEAPLLLDPTRDDPLSFLKFHVEHQPLVSVVLVRSAAPSMQQQAAVSIHVYGLNRLGLVQDRTRLLRQLHFLGDIVIDLASIIQDLTQVTALTAQEQVVLDRAIDRLRLLQRSVLSEIQTLAAPSSPYSEMVRAWIAWFANRVKN